MQNIEFWYSDIETFAPSTSPQFWCGGMYNKDAGYHMFKDFKGFFEMMIAPTKADKKVFVFHNSSYDMSIIQYHAEKTFNYKVNPSDNGQKYSIYLANQTEIYTDDNTRPATIVIDSKDLLPGRLANYGVAVGMEKLDSPDFPEVWREPTEEELEYLERDVMILYHAFTSMDDELGISFEDIVAEGNLTASSATQAQIRKQRDNYKASGLKTRYSAPAKSAEPKKVAIPSSVSDAIQAQIELEKAKHENTLYKISESVWDSYMLVLRKFYLKMMRDAHANYDKLQKACNKVINKEDKSLVERRDVQRFLSLKMPSVENVPVADKLVNEDHMKNVVASVNNRIASSMKGGISKPRFDIVGKKLGKGFVIDANSMYPSIIQSFDIPSKYAGSSMEPPDLNGDEYFVSVIKRLKARVKDGHEPWLKRATRYNDDRFYENEIDWKMKEKRTDKINNVPDAALSSVELKRLFDTYDVEILEFEETFYFKVDHAELGRIRKHIVEWENKKVNAKSDMTRVVAKIFLNTIWGRWGMHTKTVESAGRRVDVGDKHTNLVSATFVTAYARIWLSKISSALYDEFVYSDTDSIHGVYTERIPNRETLENHLGDLIEAKTFGKWDFETEFAQAKYLKPKTYFLELKNGQNKIVTAGASDEATIENIDEFNFGVTLNTTKSFTDDFGRIVIRNSKFSL